MIDVSEIGRYLAAAEGSISSILESQEPHLDRYRSHDQHMVVDQGSNGVTDVKKSNTLKMLLLIHITSYSHVTHVCEVSTHSVNQLCSISRSGVKWVTGVKRSNTLKCYYPCILQAIAMLLMYMKYLPTLYTSCAPLVDQGSNEVIRVKRSKITKITINNQCYK